MLRAGARPRPDAAPSTSEPPPEGAEPSLHELYATLNEYLQLESKFQPRLYLPADPEHGEVSSGARDGAAHVLRCLKVWYDLPPDVLIHAINLLDRFLTKMKVRPCHVPCITVSCMNIAIEEFAADNNEVRKVSVEELVSISQSACTARDVARMSRVIADKLSLAGAARAVTLLSWVRLARALVHAAAAELALPPHLYRWPESELVTLVEIVSCDAACANARTAALALALLAHGLEARAPPAPPAPAAPARRLQDFLAHLQRICNIPAWACAGARAAALGVLSRYEARGAAPHRQRLVWRLSERTLRALRPTDRLTSLLPTIQEQHLTARNRSGSESSVNEEMSDWPCSPVLPVYCDN